MRPSKRLLGLLCVLAISLVVAVGLPRWWLLHDSALDEFLSAAKLIEPLHQRKQPSKENDWLAKYSENGQTFLEYEMLGSNAPTEKKATIYVVPIGEFSSEQDALIDSLTQWLETYYALPARRLPSVPMGDVPEDARRGSVETDDAQVLAPYLIDEYVTPNMPSDALVTVGITTHDIWPSRSFGFVFGLAQGDRGIVSLDRFGSLKAADDDVRIARLRAIKVTVHEVGHMLGIMHCTAYECRMNGANGRRELDEQPLWLCPECEAKVWWATRCNRRQRYERLTDLARQNDFAEAATLWSKSAQAME